jgi:Fur family ferric uptake transcriptional regulator
MKSKKNPASETKAKSLLTSQKLKQTGPRMGLLTVLIEDHGPFTIDELHHKLAKARLETTDLATVYRTMTRFEERGLVVRCDFGDGAVRYELASSGHHHHHIICQKCQKVTALGPCQMDLSSLLTDTHGYQQVTHKLEFFGICPACASA